MTKIKLTEDQKKDFDKKYLDNQELLKFASYLFKKYSKINEHFRVFWSDAYFIYLMCVKDFVFDELDDDIFSKFNGYLSCCLMRKIKCYGQYGFNSRRKLNNRFNARNYLNTLNDDLYESNRDIKRIDMLDVFNNILSDREFRFILMYYYDRFKLREIAMGENPPISTQMVHHVITNGLCKIGEHFRKSCIK